MGGWARADRQPIEGDPVTTHPSRAWVRGLIGTAAAVAVALPCAAFAGTLTHVDPGKDVQKVASTPSGVTVTRAPSQRTADIVRFAARYTSTALTESTRLRGLGATWSYHSRIRTPATHFDVTLLRQSGTTNLQLTEGPGIVAVTCPGLGRRISRTKHVVAVTVPTECLGSPGWVQAGARMSVFPAAGGVVYVDDALRTSHGNAANLALSGRLRP
jgi:hypothetical protein